MFCEVFFFYSSETPYEKILKKINECNESFQIITNRTGLEEFLLNQGENVSMVDVAIPSIGNIELEVDKRSKKNFMLV